MAAASEGQVWPATGHGWLIAALQSLTVQVGGQTLIAASFAYVPAGFGAMVLLLQPIVAAILAWAMFHESLGLWQAVGAIAILGGRRGLRGRASSFKNPGAPSCGLRPLKPVVPHRRSPARRRNTLGKRLNPTARN